MNKHKLILLVFFLFSIGFLFAQERNFEEEIEDTEKQIQLLQASIKKNDEEIQKVTSQEKTTSQLLSCLLYTSPSPRDGLLSRMPSSA